MGKHEGMAQEQNYLICTDLELTGLDPTRDYIIEIATIITDSNLKVIAEGPEVVIRQSEEILGSMDEWNTRQHKESGLTDRVRHSPYNTSDAERLTLDFVREHVPPGKSPMCGNSICQDRRFLARLMPELEEYFHYRNLDVSSIKELALRWTPKVAKGFSKESNHRALDDIRASIEELRYYREHFIRL